ncbi:MAG: M28 family peptidase [Bacteroidales bacterium]
MNKIQLYITITAIIFLASCGGDKDKATQQQDKPASSTQAKKEISVPDFNADSAYYYVKKQVDFGPRVPGSQAHKECAVWLSQKLSQYTDSVITQNFSAKIYTGANMPGKNIIGIVNPDKKKRIVLCAHWDSRPYADQEKDPALHNTPIDGANDGASGVGVLLELARLMHKEKPALGIDIIFFDLEDYGEPQGQQSPGSNNTWALGSHYWSRNPHTFNYSATYGILLDMVGVKNATFPYEGFSRYYAGDILEKVWNTAHSLGYGNSFVRSNAGRIIDDHLYMNQIAGIPTINIIALDNEGDSQFFEHWHTLQDNMDNISKQTLNAVGNTVAHVIYTEK